MKTGNQENIMDVITALKNRRAINFFDPDKKIPEAAVRELLETANQSPSSMNLQPWEVIVVTDSERKKALRKCAFNQAKAEEAPAVFIIIANPLAVEENIDSVLANLADLGYIKPEDIEKQRSGPFSLYGGRDSITRKIFAVKNASFFAMSVMAAARGLGLETHPMDGFNEADLKKIFKIAENKIVPLLIAVGYPRPGLKLLPGKFRRKIEDFVKFNMYE